MKTLRDVDPLVLTAILGLLAAVFLFFMFPSDDRTCRLEAERLAAYLTAASAEAVMRDAATRVTVDFTAQSANRESARVGASVTDRMWEDDAFAPDRRT